MVLVDSHCHIPLMQKGTEIEIEEIISAAKDVGVEHMLCVSTDLETYPEILALAQQYDCISASFGIHPNATMEEEITLDTLIKMSSDSKVVAVGETGLDYFRSVGDLEWQRERLRTHIKAAKSVNKPLIIHTREASDDLLRILEEEGAEETGGVMHCFVEDWDTAQRAIKMNFYISFSGIVTFKNSQQVKETAKRIPLEWMLLETDAPYLAPVPHRGKPNQPAYTRYVAEYIAELRSIDVQQIAEQTTENFCRLFNVTNISNAQA